MIGKLTDEEREQVFWREELGDAARAKALRIIDQLTEALTATEELWQSDRVLAKRALAAEARVRELTEALEAERAENADHLKVNRELASNLIAAEAQVRDFKVRHQAASAILAGAGTFLDSAALEALQGTAPAAAPASRPRAALRRLRAMLLERGEAELIRLVDLALKDGAG